MYSFLCVYNIKFSLHKLSFVVEWMNNNTVAYVEVLRIASMCVITSANLSLSRLRTFYLCMVKKASFFMLVTCVV